MKFFIIALLSFILFNSSSASIGNQKNNCGSDASWTTEGFSGEFTCSPSGVSVNFNVPGCRCNESGLYYNTATHKCSPVNCPNMDCVGKENEKFFGDCQSGSRDQCGCSRMATMDCRRGCMCKNGFCRNNGKCVKRDCVHPFYS